MIKQFVWLGIGLLLLGLIPSPAVAAQTTTLNIRGRIVKGTPDGQDLPETLPIELQVVSASSASASTTLTVLTTPEGDFTFEDVPRVSGSDFYVLFAEYAGVRQRTTPFYPDQANFVSFVLYETTDQLDNAVIINGSMQIDEFTMNPIAGVTLAVVMEVQVQNLGDRIIYAPPTAERASATSFHFELPVGAYGVAEVTPEDAPSLTHVYIEDGSIPVVYDTLPLIPHWPRPSTIRVTYFLLYAEEAVIDLPLAAPVEAFTIWVPRDTVYLSSEQFTLIEDDRALDESRPNYRVYQQNQPTDRLLFTLSGRPTETLTNTQRTTQSASSNGEGLSLIAVLSVVFGFIVVIWGWIIWRQRRIEAHAGLENKSQ